MLDKIKREFLRAGKTLSYSQPGDSASKQRITVLCTEEFNVFWALLAVTKTEVGAASAVMEFIKRCAKLLVTLPPIRPDTLDRGSLLDHEEKAKSLVNVAGNLMAGLRDTRKLWSADTRNGILARIESARRFLKGVSNPCETVKDFMRDLETIARQF